MVISRRRIFFLIVIAFILGSLPHLASVARSLVEVSPDGHLLISATTRNFLQTFWSTTRTYLFPLVGLYIVFIAGLIFMEGQNPDRTIAWLLALALLPGVGLALYLIFGPDLRHLQRRKKYRRWRKHPPAKYDMATSPPTEVVQLATLLRRSGDAEVCFRNEVDVLFDGEETFGAILSALRGAKEQIHMEYFIIHNDGIGCQIADILMERSRAGVVVRVLYDAVGSWKLGRSYLKALHEAGIETRAFSPASFPMLRLHPNNRNHRKIVVVDRTVAFMGGLNIGDEYLGRSARFGHWRDTHACFRGDSVRVLQQIFAEDWAVAGLAVSKEELEVPPTTKEVRQLPLQIVASGPHSGWHPVKQGYLGMIAGAKKRVWIASPYFVPDAGLFDALISAGLSGVDARLLIPSTSDHVLVFWCSRSYVESLLQAGVRVFMYRKGFMHAKVLIVDDAITSLGTANFDLRSLDINFEVQAFMFDQKLNERMGEQFERDFADSKECLYEEWVSRPFFDKVRESLGRLASSQL